jgi:hypothetical protein
MNSTKDTPAPSVSTKLGDSFKSLVHDSGSRKPATGTIKNDEDGHTKPKRAKKVSEKLMASLVAKLK